MNQICYWNKPCSARIHRTVDGDASVGRDVRLFFGVASYCQTAAQVIAQMRRCQLVVLEEVTVALK